MQDLLDKDKILNYFMEDKELLTESIEIFAKGVPQRLNKLKEAIINNNFEMITIEAHSLKGMIAIFTTGKSFELAKELEFMGRKNDKQEIKNKFNIFLEEIKFLHTNLNNWKKELI